MCKNKPIDCNFTSDIDLNSPKACSSSNDMNSLRYPRLPILSLFTTFNKDTHTFQRRSIKVRCKAKILHFKFEL